MPINYITQFFLNLVFRSIQIEDAMKIEEYVPATTPTIRGSAKLRISVTPKIKSDSTMIKVVIDVNRLREIVWLTLLFTRDS